MWSQGTCKREAGGAESETEVGGWKQRLEGWT